MFTNVRTMKLGVVQLHNNSSQYPLEKKNFMPKNVINDKSALFPQLFECFFDRSLNINFECHK